MKRIFCLLLVLSVLLGTGCAGGDLPPVTDLPPETESSPQQVTQTPSAMPQLPPDDAIEICLSADWLETLWGHTEAFDAAAYAASLTEQPEITEAALQQDGSIRLKTTPVGKAVLLLRLETQLEDRWSGGETELHQAELSPDGAVLTLYVDTVCDPENPPLFVREKQFLAVQWQGFAESWSGTLETRLLDAETGALLGTVPLENLAAE